MRRGVSFGTWRAIGARVPVHPSWVTSGRRSRNPHLHALNQDHPFVQRGLEFLAKRPEIRVALRERRGKHREAHINVQFRLYLRVLGIAEATPESFGRSGETPEVLN